MTMLSGSEPVQESRVMTDELLSLLKQRIASQYYNKPEVVEIIARAILYSRGIYPQ
jgi:hypothetical protein